MSSRKIVCGPGMTLKPTAAALSRDRRYRGRGNTPACSHTSLKKDEGSKEALKERPKCATIPYHCYDDTKAEDNQ